jgi:DNA polymerase II large subunit
MDFASNNINEPLPDALKSPRAVMSKDKIVEPLEKGILRAKYRLYVNKDGTIRYDATNAPLTHFKPCEIHVTVDEIRALGYTKDIYGNEVTSEDQILLLMPQDIIISDNPESSCAEYLLNVGRFIDDLLVKFYKMEPYYNFKRKEDLLGHYVVGLAPHTSAGIIGRIIGFTKAKCCFAHPYWHAAKRRNADGDEDSIMLLMDPLLNFSKHFLPEHVGGRSMDAPLVLSAILKVDEVDDEAWGVDVAEKYPLEFYEATLQYKYPWSVKVKTFADKIKEKDSFYSNFTHNTSRITYDEIKSAYVNLKEMSDKVSSQLKLAERILAVDENDVAELLLETHFLVDIKGNLRTFSKQEFRCTTCNEKYRRIPLKGVCRRCNKKLNLTVFEGTVKKYLEHSCEIATKYRVSEYTLQQIQNLKKYIQSIFGKEVKQKLLGVFLNNG